MNKLVAYFFGFIHKIYGKNYYFTPKSVILNQLNEKRPLPLGMSEFQSWSDRIIAGAMLKATPESQKFALADMLLHLGPTVDHECDAYFIKSLRKYAINQVAVEVRKTLYASKEKRLETENSTPINPSVAVTSQSGVTNAPNGSTNQVLSNKGV